MVSGPAEIVGDALTSTTNKIIFYNSFTEIGTYVVKLEAFGVGFGGET